MTQSANLGKQQYIVHIRERYQMLVLLDGRTDSGIECCPFLITLICLQSRFVVTPSVVVKRSASPELCFTFGERNLK